MKIDHKFVRMKTEYLLNLLPQNLTMKAKNVQDGNEEHLHE